MRILQILGTCCFLWLGLVYELQAQTFKKEYIHPQNGYTQVVAITQGNVKTIHVSGQIGEGDNLASQMRSVWANMRKELQAAGAGLGDLVKINTYIVDYKPADLAVFRDIREEVMGDMPRPASTLVGVTSLAGDGWLVEMDAVAVVEIK